MGTQTKVIEVALDRLAHHWDADEIQRQHPHLTLGQIYSCLAYYYDHQEEMDGLVEEQLRAIKRFRSETGGSVLRAKLKSSPIRAAYPLLDEMAAKAGWDDPALDVYNDMIPRDK